LSNLTSGEIVEQLLHANSVERIRNVVFMGMGEPLDNYTSVLTAVRCMSDTGRFGLSPSRISVSTVGVVPKLRSLAQDLPDVGLALSLHAPNQALRQQIVPTAKAWNIHRILEATDAFIDQQNARISSQNRKKHVLVEYVLIHEINDMESVAHELGDLLQGRAVLLNVIPYNPTSVPFDYKPPSHDKTTHFVSIVRSYGVHTLLRQELGQDIASACGQLVIDKANNACKTDMEDLYKVQKPLAKRRMASKRTKSAPWDVRVGLLTALLGILASYLLVKYSFKSLGLW
jgi:adenine C2-methylase RlmN of 23S rRNA A2503 and tRNA A37